MMNLKCIFCGGQLKGTTTRGVVHIECDAEYWDRRNKNICTRCNKPMDGETDEWHVECVGTNYTGYSVPKLVIRQILCMIFFLNFKSLNVLKSFIRTPNYQHMTTCKLCGKFSKLLGIWDDGIHDACAKEKTRTQNKTDFV